MPINSKERCYIPQLQNDIMYKVMRQYEDLQVLVDVCVLKLNDSYKKSIKV